MGFLLCFYSIERLHIAYSTVACFSEKPFHLFWLINRHHCELFLLEPLFAKEIVPMKMFGSIFW